jgi:hypothetical protein
MWVVHRRPILGAAGDKFIPSPLNALTVRPSLQPSPPPETSAFTTGHRKWPGVHAVLRTLRHCDSVAAVGDRALSGSTASEFDIRDEVPDGQGRTPHDWSRALGHIGDSPRFPDADRHRRRRSRSRSRSRRARPASSRTLPLHSKRGNGLNVSPSSASTTTMRRPRRITSGSCRAKISIFLASTRPMLPSPRSGRRSTAARPIPTTA